MTKQKHLPNTNGKTNNYQRELMDIMTESKGYNNNEYNTGKHILYFDVLCRSLLAG